RADFSLRFGESPPFAPGCRFVRIDAEPGGGPVTREIVGEPAAVARQLTAAAAARAWPARDWAAQVAAPPAPRPRRRAARARATRGRPTGLLGRARRARRCPPCASAPRSSRTWTRAASS